MIALVKLLGTVVAAFGVIFLLRPDAIKSYMDFWTKGKRIYAGAVLNLIAGIVFLLAASQCRLTLIIALFGIWGIIKGVILFVRGPKMVKSMVDWWKERPAVALRLVAILCLVFGAIIIYAA